MSYSPRPLPEDVRRLCDTIDAPPRLVAHLTIVHDVAGELVDAIQEYFPNLTVDADSVLFGAATHDLGKVSHRSELTGPGSQHEQDGPTLLEEQGIPTQLARFARTHGSWSVEELPLEDLLVALADCVWKGQRLEELETQVTKQLSDRTGKEQWEVFSKLDGLLEEIANRGDERLAWQQVNG